MIQAETFALPAADEARRLLGRILALPPAQPMPPPAAFLLYGAGNLGLLARDYCRHVGLTIGGFVDRNAQVIRQTADWAQQDVRAPHEISLHEKQTLPLMVGVVTTAYAPLAAELEAQGFAKPVPFYDVTPHFTAVHPLDNGWFSGAVSPDEAEKIEKVLLAWNDDVSRAAHLQFLAWRCARAEWTFAGAPVEGHNRFFTANVMQALGPGARFLDVGGHRGESLARFAEARAGDYGAMLTVEPDSGSFSVVQQAIEKFGSKAKAVKAALWSDRNERLFHAGLGYASQFAPSGHERISPLLMDDLDFAPDLLKLHIEGGEIEVLKGGHGMIAKQRPIIALTSYHDRLGLYDMPLWVMDHLPDYAVTMRLHSWHGTGAVIYAIPRERL